MRDPQQPRRRWPGPALGLLLTALALAACGGSGDADAAKSSDAASADSGQARLAAAATSDTTCAPPPAVPQSLVQNGASWAALEAFLADSGISFPDTPANIAVDTVPLCPECSKVGVRLQSTNRTYCLTTQAASTQRIAGRLTLLDTFPAQHNYGTIPKNGVLYMLSRGTPAGMQPATLVYREGDKVRRAPGTAWRFYYCAHDSTVGHPAAQWRPENVPPQGPSNTGGGGGNEGGSYAWMSCANGCCQFYTPPPMTEFPDLPDRGKTPDAHPGRDSIPRWCMNGSNHP
jgi:hypothetical protein